MSACSPELVVGEVEVEVEQPVETECEPTEAGGAPNFDEKVVEVGWSTGFENGFKDYYDAFGKCYHIGDASCALADSPVHQGKYAGAFSIVTTTPAMSAHTRCFLQGAFPVDAVYGAWFYIPAFAEARANWNLMYIQGANVPIQEAGLWDVSLGNGDDGRLRLHIYGHDMPSAMLPEAPITVPMGRWFHVEFRWVRAKDGTGSVSLRQDGVLLQEMTDIVTDRFDFHEWYVGNLGEELVPAESTIYVDDVSVSAPP